MRAAPAWGALALVWSLSLLVHGRQGAALWLFPFFFLSALLLSAGAGAFRRLFGAGLLFFLGWSAFRLLLGHVFQDEGEFSPLSLGCYMFSGLHLLFAWTPLELSRAAGGFLRVFLGRRRAALCAVALTALVRAAPWILADALALRRTLAQRAGGLSHFARLSLWAGALARLSFRRAEDLSRALAQRQGAAGGGLL
jgi:hypothetical protein